MTVRAIKAWTFSNVIAGSDSTGVVLKTTMYNLIKHPRTLEKLRTELLEAGVDKSTPHPRWAEVRDLPYLDACVNEGSRLHPPFCLPFERVVPKEGIVIGGRALAPGTVVGMSPWVANRHKATWGDDADQWRPERWLEGGHERRKRLDGSLLTVSIAIFPLIFHP